jgi:hypothetical protein
VRADGDLRDVGAALADDDGELRFRVGAPAGETQRDPLRRAGQRTGGSSASAAPTSITTLSSTGPSRSSLKRRIFKPACLRVPVGPTIADGPRRRTARSDRKKCEETGRTLTAMLADSELHVLIVT